MNDTSSTRSRATASQVAEALGVSRVMVSRAFNPDASIRDEMRRSILAKAAELGYAPDKAARAVATGRSDLVALVVPSLSHPWESQEVDALCRTLQDMSLTPVIYRIPAHEADYVRLLRVEDYRPGAVVAYMDRIDPETLLPYFGNCPAIYPYYSSRPPERGGQTVDLLRIDQWAGIRNAVRLFREAGRQRVAYVGGTGFSSCDIDRHAAFVDAMADAGLRNAGRLEGEFDYDTARAQVNAFLRGGGRADAFFCANDVSAFGTMDALRHDFGLDVPREAAVVGFDGIDQANWAAYDLTTVAIPLEQRVAAIARMIEARRRAPDLPTQSETIVARLVVRSSA